VKIGAKVMRHGRYIIFQMAEVAVPRELFKEISAAHCGTAPTAGCDAAVRRLTVPCSKANDRSPAP
jgi:hypothetical protein